MKEFEELEGLTDQHIDDEISNIDDTEEDDASFRPTIAANLNNSDVYYEMEKRNLKTTGFPDTDREVLQKAFDEEFKQDLENARLVRREVRRRAARQAGLQRRRMMMEKMLQEEQDEVTKNHHIGMMIELVRENLLGSSARLDINSVGARALAKAMWVNNSITCLDLSSNDLSDHAGSYLARMLKRNNTIRKLELDNNQLGPLTCTAFGESLSVNTTLVYLSLDSNPLVNPNNIQGFTAFAESLAVNTGLKSLNIWRVGAGQLGGSIFSRHMCNNKQLLFCDVSHNGMDMKDVVKVANQLDSNLAAFEEAERLRRQQQEASEQVEKSRRDKEEGEQKQKELSSWLEERRCQRAESRRLAEVRPSVLYYFVLITDIRRNGYSRQRLRWSNALRQLQMKRSVNERPWKRPRRRRRKRKERERNSAELFVVCGSLWHTDKIPRRDAADCHMF